MTNYKELVKWCYSKLGTHYLYGYKGQIITKNLNNYFAENYPSVWTKKYLNVANSWIGSVACDCSGLISWKTGKLRGSWEYYETAKETIEYKKGMDLTKYIGWGIWKKGHIGVVVSSTEVIEERGQAYGCVKTIAKDRDFTHLIKLIDIDYSSYDYENVGWNKDNIGWWYAYGHSKGEYYKNTIKEIDGCFYAFDSRGYMKTGMLSINSKGQIQL